MVVRKSERIFWIQDGFSLKNVCRETSDYGCSNPHNYICLLVVLIYIFFISIEQLLCEVLQICRQTVKNESWSGQSKLENKSSLCFQIVNYWKRENQRTEKDNLKCCFFQGKLSLHNCCFNIVNHGEEGKVLYNLIYRVQPEVILQSLLLVQHSPNHANTGS